MVKCVLMPLFALLGAFLITCIKLLLICRRKSVIFIVIDRRDWWYWSVVKRGLSWEQPTLSNSVRGVEGDDCRLATDCQLAIQSTATLSGHVSQSQESTQTTSLLTLVPWITLILSFFKTKWMYWWRPRDDSSSTYIKLYPSYTLNTSRGGNIFLYQLGAEYHWQQRDHPDIRWASYLS